MTYFVSLSENSSTSVRICLESVDGLVDITIPINKERQQLVIKQKGWYEGTYSTCYACWNVGWVSTELQVPT